MKFLTETLLSSHKKSEFTCGKDLLDNYLHRQAGQDIKRKLTACFVFVDNATNLIQGYYTLSNYSIPLEMVPDHLMRRLPKTYFLISATLLGRLAVEINSQKKGVGRILLIDALKRSFEVSKTIGSFAVVVDPLDDEASDFYTKYGFIMLPDSGKMFLPMETIKQLF